ncbi:MAG: alpha/beta fold hydrolase [Chloroflexi bacterium]|nr:alpha/beta fold hydrolase [Chloroflexota bacterium]
MTMVKSEKEHDRIEIALLNNRIFFLLRELSATLIVILVMLVELAAFWFVVNHSNYLILILVTLTAGFVLVAYLAARPTLHPHRSQPSLTPTDVGLATWEEICLQTSDGVELRAWFVPPEPGSDGATLVFVHGLSGNRGQLLQEAAMLARHGYGALLLDLRNHGNSKGNLTTLGFSETEDVRAAVRYLLSRPEVNPDQIGLMGHSMGGATVLRAAARIPEVRAIVAQSTFSSIRENIAQSTLSQAGLPSFLFAPLMIWLGEHVSGLRVNAIRPIDDLAQLSPRAVLFIHGLQDHTVDTENSLRLYMAAKEPKELYLIDNVAHKRLMLASPEEYEKRVVTFLDRYLRGKLQ